jgi:hypothetical protein
MLKILTVEELAEDAFVKSEHVKALAMMNTPTDYDARKKAFVEMSVARAAANKAEALLHAAMDHRAKPPKPYSGDALGSSGWVIPPSEKL